MSSSRQDRSHQPGRLCLASAWLGAATAFDSRFPPSRPQDGAGASGITRTFDSLRMTQAEGAYPRRSEVGIGPSTHGCPAVSRPPQDSGGTHFGTHFAPQNSAPLSGGTQDSGGTSFAARRGHRARAGGVDAVGVVEQVRQAPGVGVGVDRELPLRIRAPLSGQHLLRHLFPAPLSGQHPFPHGSTPFRTGLSLYVLR